jgi:hypothetical protein
MGTIGKAWVLTYYIRVTDYFHEENTIAPFNAEKDALDKDDITHVQLDNENRNDKTTTAGAADADPVEALKVDITPVAKEV